jgi:hypothetical protein
MFVWPRGLLQLHGNTTLKFEFAAEKERRMGKK